MKEENPEVDQGAVKTTIKIRQDPTPTSNNKQRGRKPVEKPKRARKNTKKQGDDADYWDPDWIGQPVIVDGVKISNYVASQDLNECVIDLLKKGQKQLFT